MADITRVKTKRHEAVPFTFTTLTTAGKTVDFSGVDENTLFIFNGAGNVTFEMGDNIQGVKDITVEVTENSAISVPSMEFKKTTGENKGCLVLKGTVGVAVVEIDQL